MTETSEFVQPLKRLFLFKANQQQLFLWTASERPILLGFNPVIKYLMEHKGHSHKYNWRRMRRMVMRWRVDETYSRSPERYHYVIPADTIASARLASRYLQQIQV